MEPDPIGLEGGLNPYAYAGNNPVMNVDPSGLSFSPLDHAGMTAGWGNFGNDLDRMLTNQSIQQSQMTFNGNGPLTTYGNDFHNTSNTGLLAGTFAITGGGDSTPVKGKAGGSSLYISDDNKGWLNNIVVGSSGTTADTIGFGASLGVGVDYYKGNINDQFSGLSQTQEICFIIICGRYHQTMDGKFLGFGFSPLTEVGGSATHFFNNTSLYHAPKKIK